MAKNFSKLKVTGTNMRLSSPILELVIDAHHCVKIYPLYAYYSFLAGVTFLALQHIRINPLVKKTYRILLTAWTTAGNRLTDILYRNINLRYRVFRISWIIFFRQGLSPSLNFQVGENCHYRCCDC